MRILIIGLLILMVAGCSTQNSPEASATATPARATATTEREVEEETVELTLDMNTSTSEPAVLSPIIRSTLPPTWTPMPTETLLPTRVRATSEVPEVELTQELEVTAEAFEETPEVNVPFTPVFVPTLSSSCATFSVDVALTVRSLSFGEAPFIAWTPVSEAVLYRVVVINIREEEVYRELVEATQMTIPAEAFTELGFYGWLVTPFDPIGFPICDAVGETINITR